MAQAIRDDRCPEYLTLGPQGRCRLPYGHEGPHDYEPAEEADGLVRSLQAVARGEIDGNALNADEAVAVRGLLMEIYGDTGSREGS